MSAVSCQTDSITGTSGNTGSRGSLPATLAEVDSSCRTSVLLLVFSGLGWLLVGLLLSVVNNIKLLNPDFLNQCAWITLGRLRAVELNVYVYGFATELALGIVLWLICRLSQTRLVSESVINAAAIFWNLGLTLGIGGILAGESTGIRYLELPRFCTPILFVSFVLIGGWTWVAFQNRKQRTTYASQWYLLGAVLWFPWVFSAAQLLLVLGASRGVVQSAVGGWYAHNLIGLWLTPVALGAIYYFLPLILGRPIHGYSLSRVGFWTLAVFSGWAGVRNLVGGPLPAWMITVSVVSSVLMLIPVLVIAMNHLRTLVGHLGEVFRNTTLRFLAVGALSFALSNLLAIFTSFRSVSAVSQFTYWVEAQSLLALYGFVGMTLLGSIHFILPKLTQKEWPCRGMQSVHFWFSVLGIFLMVIPLLWGGWLQGKALLNPKTPFLEVVQATVPYLRLRTAGSLVFLLGQLAFLGNLLWMIVQALLSCCPFEIPGLAKCSSIPSTPGK